MGRLLASIVFPYFPAALTPRRCDQKPAHYSLFQGQPIEIVYRFLSPLNTKTDDPHQSSEEIRCHCAAGRHNALCIFVAVLMSVNFITHKF